MCKINFFMHDTCHNLLFKFCRKGRNYTSYVYIFNLVSYNQCFNVMRMQFGFVGLPGQFEN